MRRRAFINTAAAQLFVRSKLLVNCVPTDMMVFATILVGTACFAGLVWLYLKVYERIFGHLPESVVLSYLRRRNRPRTLFGEND